MLRLIKLKVFGGFCSIFLSGCIFTGVLQYLVFFYNTAHYTIPLQTNLTINTEQHDVIFMYQTNDTDENFYKMLGYADNIIFIGDQNGKCTTTPCLELQREYNYTSLDIKLIDTFTQLLVKFPQAKTFAKLDDDAIVHPRLYYDLVNKFQPNHYAGWLREYIVDNIKFKFVFMKVVFTWGVEK